MRGGLIGRRWGTGECLRKYVLILLTFAALSPGCVDKSALLAKPPDQLVSQVQTLLPAAEKFVVRNQEKALRLGHPLTSKYLRIAKELGIDKADKIRIYTVHDLPAPQDQKLADAARALGYNSPDIVAYTYGYGIWIKDGNQDNNGVLIHELIHVRQAERMGLKEQIRQYLTQLFIFGYRQAPLEVEAYDGTTQYLRSASP